MVSIVVFGFVFSSVFVLLSFLGLCVRWYVCVVSEPFDSVGWEEVCWSARSVYALFFPRRIFSDIQFNSFFLCMRIYYKKRNILQEIKFN